MFPLDEDDSDKDSSEEKIDGSSNEVSSLYVTIYLSTYSTYIYILTYIHKQEKTFNISTH